MRRLLLIITVLSIAAWAQQSAPAPAQPPIVLQVQMPPTPPKGVRDFIRDFGPLIAASVAVGVALMQRHLQRQHLKQSLYKLRHDVYLSVTQYWRILFEKHGVPSPEDKQLYYNTISHATFLFGEEVVAYLEDYNAVAEQYCLEYGMILNRHQHTLPDEALMARYKPVKERLDYLAGAKKTEVFRPYLQLH